jgi:hypothetical protein
MNIDRWFAKQCGVSILGGGWRPRGYAAPISGQWTIQDPRCREIVREKFKLDTLYVGAHLWICRIGEPSKPRSDDCYGEGLNLEEAELACLQAIYEASK